MKTKINIPYYTISKTLGGQIKSGSKRRKETSIRFITKKLFSYILETLAYNCPINSWRIKFHKWRGVNIGNNVFIGLRVTLDHSYPEYIYIEDDISLAGNNHILAHSNPYPHFSKVLDAFVAPVYIKKGSWLGIGSMVLPEVTIGEYSIIAAGSVVNKTIPPKVIAGGIPAKVIKDISEFIDN